MALFPSIKDGDWSGVRKALQKLGSANGLGPTSTPTFAGLTLTGLTASRLVSTDSVKALASVTDLTTWVAGTANEIDITDDGDGTITIGIVNPLIVGKGGSGAATLTDHGILLGSGTDAFTALEVATNGQLPIGSTGLDPVLATLTGTANRVTITNGTGSITLSGPQDVHTGASPTFTGMKLDANLVIDASTTVPYNPAYYAEGIRINRATNLYATLHLGAVAGSTSGTAIGEWTVARQGDGTAALRIYNNLNDGNGITILTTGEVGIGNITPTTAFEVNGTITAADLSLSTPSLVYNLNHDSFTGFVANEHIDHSTVSITAGTGMSGGGDITVSRTLNCTITQYTDEMVDDRVAVLIQNGTGLSWTYNDVANTLTGNVSITQYTDEMAQDAIGTILTDSSSVDFTYDDVLNTITAAVLPAGVDHDALLNFAAGEHFVQTAITNVSSALATGLLKVTTGTGALSVITDSSANWDSAYTHVSSTGDDHTWLNQSVTTSASPVLAGLDLTGITDGYVPYIGVGALAASPIYTDGTNIGIGTTNLNSLFSLDASLGTKFLIYNGGLTGSGGNGIFVGFSIDQPAANDATFFIHSTARLVFGRRVADLGTITPFFSFSAANDMTVTGSLDVTGTFAATGIATFSSVLFLVEQAADAADVAGQGQIWVKNDVPNTLHFTNDTGNDLSIATSSGTTGGAGSAGSGNQYVELNIGGVVYKVLHDGTV